MKSREYIPRQNTKSCLRTNMEVDVKKEQTDWLLICNQIATKKKKKRDPGDLGNGVKMGMWFPLSDHSLDQSSWWDEVSKYLPSRTEIYEKQYVSTLLYGFDENCSRKLDEHLNEQKAYHWATEKSPNNLGNPSDQIWVDFWWWDDDPEWATVDHSSLFTAIWGQIVRKMIRDTEILRFWDLRTMRRWNPREWALHTEILRSSSNEKMKP